MYNLKLSSTSSIYRCFGSYDKISVPLDSKKSIASKCKD